MKNFRILSADEPEQEPASRLWEVGTALTFQTVAGQLKASLHIPVTFAA